MIILTNNLVSLGVSFMAFPLVSDALTPAFNGR